MPEHSLPPRIPRAEAIWINGDSSRIEWRMYDLQQKNERLIEEIEACNRDLARLHGQNHEVVSEYEKLARKLELGPNGEES